MDTRLEPQSTTKIRFPVRSWLALFVAAQAMVATLPGRTHGLGLITEPLLEDLNVDPFDYANINLWAALLGALFCVPCGWLLDKLGSRLMLVSVCGLLGLVVMGMSWLPADELSILFFFVLLTRGLGQSALSVVSLTLMGKAVVSLAATGKAIGRNSGLVVGVFSILTAMGFTAAFTIIRHIDPLVDWRVLWAGIGVAVLIFGLVWWIPLRLEPRYETATPETNKKEGFTLQQALRTPAFWAFAVATSFYGMIAAGTSLYGQSILEERGFGRQVFLTMTALGPLIGLVANLSTGTLATRVPLHYLLTGAMLVLMSALLLYPFVQTFLHVYAYVVVLGWAGGMVTVLFFAVWARLFGEAHLGQVQGAAQMLTVLASALGPVVFVMVKKETGSYVLLYQIAALVAGGLAIGAWLVPQPRKVSAASPQTAEVAA